MRIKFITLIILELVSVSVFAQDSSNTSLKQSAFAVQFRVYGSLDLSTFQGSAISVKYHILDNSSIRIGFGIRSKYETESIYNDRKADPINSFSFLINAQFIQNTIASNNISLYYGGGPYYERKYSEYRASEMVDNEWKLGISSVLGVEWFFKENMSLHGEYGLLFFYSSKSKVDYNEDKTLSKSFELTDYNLFKIGLSVYL